MRPKLRQIIVSARDFDGRTIRRVFCDPLDAAEFRILLARRFSRYEAGLPLLPIDSFTFGEWVKRWLCSRKKLRPESTWRGEQNKLKAVWLPKFKDVKLSALHSPAISDELDALIERGLSAATRNRHRALLLRIFNDALRQDPPLIHTNPVKNIPSLPEKWKGTRPIFLTESEMHLYCMTAWKLRPEWGIVATLLAWAGLRIGEALALSWEDIQRDHIVVSRIFDITTGKYFARTKGQREGGHYCALLLPCVKKALTRLRGRKSGLLCDGLTYAMVRRLHPRTLERAELPKINLHGLRHSFALALKRRGFTRDEIGDCLGHETATATRRYTQSGIEHITQKALRLKLGR